VTRLARLGERLVPWTRIREIDACRLEREGVVLVRLLDEERAVELAGADAIDLVMRAAPAFFEGRRFSWVRSAWAIHNLVAHPVLQLLAWTGHVRLGFHVHDVTIPRPRVRPFRSR
jgi:hypothetical protein